MHDDQRAEVELRKINRVPVAAEREVHGHRTHRDQPNLKVRDSDVENRRVGVLQREEPRHQVVQADRQWDPKRETQQERRVQWDRGFTVAAFTFATGRDALNAGRQSRDEREREEVREPSNANGCDRGVALGRDHGEVDEVEDVLRHHAPDDGECDREDSLRSVSHAAALHHPGG